MIYSLSKKQERLPLFASLVMSFLLAAGVAGQESVLNTIESESSEQPSSELKPGCLPSALIPLKLIGTGCDFDIGCSAAGQVAITSQSWCRKNPVYVCPNDDVWLVSARDSHCAPSDLSRLRCSRLENGNWKTAQLEELICLHSTDKTKVTMLYVHGNRTSTKWAWSRGLQFYETAFQTEKRPPIRFVIFAWRSDTELVRPIPDYNIKSERSVMIGETFAQLLCRFTDRKMVIGGFSLGAQVVLSAVSKPGLQVIDERPGKYRIAVFAPALNSEFIQSKLECFPYNPVVYPTYVFLNQNDLATKVSRSLARKSTRSDLSLRKLATTSPRAETSILIRDITCEVSRRHSIVNYGYSVSINVEMARLLNATFEDQSAGIGSDRQSVEARVVDIEMADAKFIEPN